MPNKSSEEKPSAKKKEMPPLKLPPIAYVLLGRLAQEDQTGYELASFMGPPRNYIWEASHSQIYPLMSQLTEHKLVTFTDIPQIGKPNKKVYRVTQSGLDALMQWLLSPPAPMPRRLEFNAKVNSLWLLPVEQAIDILDQQIEMTRNEIRMIEGHLAEAQQRTGISFPPPPRSKYSGIYANIRYALGSRRYMIRWYKWVQQDLRAGASHSALDDSS